MAELRWLNEIEGRLRLDDGRILAFCDQGRKSGRPLVLCHGWPGSRFQSHPDPRLPAELGLRLITLDRPGFGRSGLQPGRRLIDAAVHQRDPAAVEGVGERHLGVDPRQPVLGERQRTHRR